MISEAKNEKEKTFDEINKQTTVHLNKKTYRKAKIIFTLMGLRGAKMSLNKLVNDRLEEFVEENQDLLEKAEKLDLDEVEEVEEE